jgi:hypothetical protein
MPMNSRESLQPPPRYEISLRTVHIEIHIPENAEENDFPHSLASLVGKAYVHGTISLDRS